MKNYQNLNDMLSHDQKAKQFLLTLPEYVQGALSAKSDSIHSFNDLTSSASSILNKG